MTLAVALILAGNLPAEERRLNEVSWFRIVSALQIVSLGLAEWEES